MHRLLFKANPGALAIFFRAGIGGDDHCLATESRIGPTTTYNGSMTPQHSAHIALRILGIDPGLRITGFGVIEKIGSKLAYITSGCVKSPSDAPLPDRLQVLLENLREVIAMHRPSQVAIEKVFVNVNPQSTLLLGQARGTAICAAVLAQLPVAEYTALQVKQSVVGNGHAKKEQVQEMVKRLLHLPGHPQADAADALACAICHAHGGQGMGALMTAGYRVRGGRLIGKSAVGKSTARAR